MSGLTQRDMDEMEMEADMFVEDLLSEFTGQWLGTRANHPQEVDDGEVDNGELYGQAG